MRVLIYGLQVYEIEKFWSCEGYAKKNTTTQSTNLARFRNFELQYWSLIQEQKYIYLVFHPLHVVYDVGSYAEVILSLLLSRQQIEKTKHVLPSVKAKFLKLPLGQTSHFREQLSRNINWEPDKLIWQQAGLAHFIVNYPLSNVSLHNKFWPFICGNAVWFSKPEGTWDIRKGSCKDTSSVPERIFKFHYRLFPVDFSA